MRIVRSLKDVERDPNSIVTVGTFDGVHRGHQSIVHELTSEANRISGRSVVITFDPHPREVVGRGPVQLLTTLDERIVLLSKLGVDVLLIVPFTYEFSRQTSRQFYERYLVNGVGVNEVIVGYDHMFGRDRESGIHELRALGEEYGFGVSVVDPVSLHGVIISSSKIRELLLRGDVERASEYLGRVYSLEGEVVVGEKRGAILGFPTANIKPIWTIQLVPANGVYAVRVTIDKDRHNGMMNIGVRPTFDGRSDRVIEVNMFNFTGDIYGRRVRVEFLKRLRSERKFASPEELVTQLHRDRDECQSFLAEHQSP